jgi:hypothetical protein
VISAIIIVFTINSYERYTVRQAKVLQLLPAVLGLLLLPILRLS